MDVSRWYRQSVRVIDAAIARLATDASPAACERAIRDAYPFGQRSMWPYKKWCEARRDALAARFPRDPRYARRAPAAAADAVQGKLFDAPAPTPAAEAFR